MVIWLKRLAAFFIDLFLVGIIAIIIGWLGWAFNLWGRPLTGTEATWGDQVFWLTLTTGYTTLLLSRIGARNGQSWGKQLLKLRVISQSQALVSPFQVVIRDPLAKTLPLSILALYPNGWLGIIVAADYSVALLRKDHRSLHDILASTAVIDTRNVLEPSNAQRAGRGNQAKSSRSKTKP
jgi:uncharacterized RDD family membrane protein YckC